MKNMFSLLLLFISLFYIISCKDNDGCQPEFVSNILGESSGDISQFTTQFGAKEPNCNITLKYKNETSEIKSIKTTARVPKVKVVDQQEVIDYFLYDAKITPLFPGNYSLQLVNSNDQDLIAKRHIKVPIKPMKNYSLSIYFVGELDPDSEATHKILELLRRKIAQSAEKEIPIVVDLGTKYLHPVNPSREVIVSVKTQYYELLGPLLKESIYQILPGYISEAYPAQLLQNKLQNVYRLGIDTTSLYFFDVKAILDGGETEMNTIHKTLNTSKSHLFNKWRIHIGSKRIEEGENEELKGIIEEEAHVFVSSEGAMYHRSFPEDATIIEGDLITPKLVKLGTKPIQIINGAGGEYIKSEISESNEEKEVDRSIASIGRLSILNESFALYSQISVEDSIVDEFYIKNEQEKDGEMKTSNSEATIAIIVIICSLGFFCYFAYSFIRCYIKKPKVITSDDESGNKAENGEGAEAGYDMRDVRRNY